LAISQVGSPRTYQRMFTAHLQGLQRLVQVSRSFSFHCSGWWSTVVLK